jgi:hypothetical protein
MHINNKCEWKVEFSVAISSIQNKTGLSKSSILRARNQLKQVGRISFKERAGNLSTVYQIIAFHTDTQSDTQSGTQSATQSGTQTDTIHKLNKTKLNNRIKLKFDYRAHLLKLIGDEGLVDEYLQVRKDKRLSNTETALKDFIKHCEKNNFDLLEAVTICVKKSWGGFDVKWLEKEKTKSTTEKLGGYKSDDVQKFMEIKLS